MRGDELLAERTVHLGSFDPESWSGKSCAIAGATKPMNDLCVRPWRYSTCERPRL